MSSIYEHTIITIDDVSRALENIYELGENRTRDPSFGGYIALLPTG